MIQEQKILKVGSEHPGYVAELIKELDDGVVLEEDPYSRPLKPEFFLFENSMAGLFPDKVEQKPVQSKKIGRNEPCPCGSNRKYKHCCGR